MSKILLAQPVLKPDWIDLSVGEPHLIREILLEEVDVNKCFPKLESEDFTYPSPCGYDKLVEYLETKHGAPVVITNGAKQGLGAAIYAAKQMGACRIWTPSPYWALLPPLFDLHGLKMTNTTLPNRDDDNDVACLVVSPNNPDGKVSNMILNQNVCNYRGSLLIHDAAYYTPIYIEGLIQKVYGDAQI
jgi:histidinol-phosphate/aromatic aminotransferase/cobyric acid decarboxylase-like protein